MHRPRAKRRVGVFSEIRIKSSENTRRKFMKTLTCLAIFLERIICLATAIPTPEAIEPQPLPEGVADTGINVLLDSSHQFNFFTHWNVQNAIRNQGHRVCGNQASLHHAITPGTPMRVRKQDDHSWQTYRPMTTIAAPKFDVIYTYQQGKYQPYLDEEKKVLRRFVEDGGGLIFDVYASDSPIAEFVEQFGVKFGDESAKVSPCTEDALPSFDEDFFAQEFRVVQFSDDWTVLIGDGKGHGVLAYRKFGNGSILLLSDQRLLKKKHDGKEHPNGELLSWMVTKVAGDTKTRDDERRVPWEHVGLGGAFYPENEISLRGINVLYADNQLPEFVELAKNKFPQVLDILQKLLPTPPNPGHTFYVDIAAGAGGGWAENAITPKLSGTISMNPDSMLSILAHELAHTMYGPEARDGKLGAGMPAWFSEAHAGWFQRKAMRDMNIGQGWPHWSGGLAKQDPLLDELDLANIPEGKMSLAWHKIWLIWSILDARYGESWYPNWCAYIHKKYSGTGEKLDMSEYIMTISETVGEDVAPLFEKFGTTVTERTNLLPIEPK